MKIKALQLSNFRSHRSTTLKDLGSLVLILGPNGSGKSGLLDAIAYAITGTCRGTDDAGRGHESLIAPGPVGQPAMSQVIMETDKGLVNRTVGQGPKSVVQEKITTALRLDRAALRCALRSQAFLDLDVKEQEALLRGLIASTVTAEQAQEAFGVTLPDIHAANLVTIDGVLAAYKFAFETRTALKRVTFTEPVWTHGDFPVNGVNVSELSIEALGDARDEAARAAENIGRLQEQAKGQERLKGEAAFIEKQLQALRDAIAPLRPLPELEALRANLQADFDKADAAWRDRQDKARKYLDDANAANVRLGGFQKSLSLLTAKAGKNTKCESCQQYVDKSTIKTIIEDLADKIKAEEKIIEASRAAAKQYDDGGLLPLPEAEPLSRVVKDIEKIKSARQQAKGLKDRAAAIKAQLEAAVAAPSVAEYQTALDTKIALQGYLQWRQAVDGVRVARAAHEQRLEAIEMAVKALGPGGPVRALHMGGGLGDLVKEVSGIAKGLGVGEVAISTVPKWAVSVNGRPAELLSASERFRASLAFAVVIAKRTGVNMVCLDGADILDAVNRPMLVQLVEGLGLDQVIVTATSTDGDAAVEGWATFHLRNENGVTVAAQPQAA